MTASNMTTESKRAGGTHTEAEQGARRVSLPPKFHPELHDVLRRDLITVESADARHADQRQSWAQLQILFEHQLRKGCGNSKCTRPTCHTFRSRSQVKPLRQLTQASISATATMLSQEPAAARNLCSRLASLRSAREGRSPLPGTAVDPSSFTQTLFATATMRTALENPNLQSSSSAAAATAVKTTILSKLEIDSIQCLAMLIHEQDNITSGQSLQVLEFLRRSCEFVLSDPMRIHCSFKQQHVGPLKDSNAQPVSDSHNTGKPRPGGSKVEYGVPLHIEAALNLVHGFFGDQVATWLARAMALLGCTSRSQYLTIGKLFRLHHHAQKTSQISVLVDVFVITLRMASKVVEMCTDKTRINRAVLSHESTTTPGLVQSLDAVILDLTQTIANRLSPYCVESAADSSQTGAVRTFHELVRRQLWFRLTGPLDGRFSVRLGADRNHYTGPRKPLILWLGILCQTGAIGTSSIKRGSPLHNAILAFDQSIKAVPRPGTVSSAPGAYWDPARFIETLSPLGRLCSPDELVKSWVNPQPGYISLLEYPFLFSGSEVSHSTRALVVCFRRICFIRMMKVYRAATLNNKMISAGFCWPTLAGLPASREQLESLMHQQPPRGIKSALLPQLEIRVSRETLLDDALNHVWKRQKRHLLAPLKVKFSDAGEIAADLGGVAQEFFRLVAEKMQSPEYGLFTLNGPKQFAWFNPGSCEPTYKYCLLGMLVALAVHNGFTLPVSFPKLLYRRLLDQNCDHGGLDGIEDGWPELVKGLRNLLDYNGNVEDDIGIDYTFALAFPGETVGLPMNEDSRCLLATGTLDRSRVAPLLDTTVPAVTNANRQRYVHDYIYFLTMATVRTQFAAFAKGFHSILDENIVATLTWPALRVLVEGHQDINVVELQLATQYVQYSHDDETINLFWTYVSSLSPDRLKKLLEFVTATDRIPVNGMQSLGFTIQKHGEDDEHLPSASTCFGILLLPAYSSAEVLQKKMDQALDNAEGFGLR